MWGRIAFLLSPLTLADIAALVPAILLLFSSSVPSVFFLLRVFRLIRFYRHSHLLQSVLELSRVVHDQRDMLVATLFLNASILLVLGAIMYYVEVREPGTEFTNNIHARPHAPLPLPFWPCDTLPQPPCALDSIRACAPHFRRACGTVCAWRAASHGLAAAPPACADVDPPLHLPRATLTTVGYGDITPTTWLGKMVGGAAAILAVGMFGLPAGILSDGFKELAEKRRSKMRTMGKVLERFKTGQSKRLTLRHWFKLSARRSRVGLALAPCVAPSPPNAPAGAALLDRAKRTWSLKSDGHSEEVVLRSSSGDEGAGGAHSAPDGKYILPSRLKHRIHVETGESDLPQPLQRGRPSTRAEQVKLEDSAAALPEAPVSGPSLLCPHCEHIIPLVVLPQAHSGTLAEQNVPREATRLQQYQLSASSRLPFGVTAQELGQPQRPDSPLDKE